jgi:hypothetical protein
MTKGRWRETAGWCALIGGALWVTCTLLIRTYYPQLNAARVPRMLAFAWVLGAISTVIGSLFAIPKWQSLFGLLATLFVIWAAVAA